MIKVTNYNNKEIHIEGHAGYAKYGKDIVCAGASGIVITTINAIIRIDEKAISYTENDGYLIIQKNNDNKIADELLVNMMNMLSELANDYPKNIKIRNEDEKL